MTRRRCSIALALAAIAGCGRTGFEPMGDGGDDDVGDAAMVGAARSTLRLDLVDPGETLVDFPLLVTLDDTRADRAQIDSSGGNLRFLDANGDVLASEIEQLGAAGGLPLLAWVRVPSIAGTTTTLTVAYGGTLPAASTESVWSASYEAVYHCENAAGDSTGNGHDGVPTGTGIATVAGFIGQAQSFDGDQAYTTADTPSLDLPSLTVSGWIYQRTASAGYVTLVGRAVANSSTTDFTLGTYSDTEYNEVVITGGTIVEGTTVAVPIGHWTHLAMTADSSMMVAYLDGAMTMTYTTGAIVEHDATDVIIGAQASSAIAPNASWLDGMVDEIRIEHGVRTPAWIAYDDASQRDALISYGPVQE